MLRLYHVLVVWSHPEPHDQPHILQLLRETVPSYDSESKPDDGKVGVVWITEPVESFDMHGTAVEAFGDEITDPGKYEIKETTFSKGDGSGRCLFVFRKKQWWQMWR